MVIFFKHFFLTPIAWLAALIFLIEEAIWDNTAALMARFAVLGWIRRIEQSIQNFPPRWALVAFLLPSLILIPAKLIGLHAIAHGQWLLGSAVFIFAKLAGMALFSRIFNLTRPALMQLPWFAHRYRQIMFYRNRIHQFLENWSSYQRIKHMIYLLKIRLSRGEKT